MSHYIDDKLVNIIGYEPAVGDPIIIKGRIQEIYMGTAIIKIDDPVEGLVPVDIDLIEFDEEAADEAKRNRQDDQQSQG